ncbi:MAG TPA: MarR family transcriptional regulator [Candidatus Binataceae bacterium]|jgi:MarR family transcriptional regulator, 2-MHQ and catechol-resistance regulon repressor|nr:MarR family transcriptional regulator [Candidatus Binataceae bacterium]
MPTHFKGKANEVRALDAYIKLSRASGTLDARLAANLARRGVTTGQLGVMEALMHLGPLTQGKLGRKLLRSGGNVTTVIDNLERRGLVGRHRNPDDRRVVTVRLTSTGRQLIEDIFPNHARAVAQAMASLTVAEQEELGRLCRKLGHRLPRELGVMDDHKVQRIAVRVRSAARTSRA